LNNKGLVFSLSEEATTGKPFYRVTLLISQSKYTTFSLMPEANIGLIMSILRKSTLYPVIFAFNKPQHAAKPALLA